ncbi:MAG: hypothetical protein KF723_23115 [Rhizobiaceae bacterium]|nr:hypothetical protein [Rhizobiaceae bacterium]
MSDKMEEVIEAGISSPHPVHRMMARLVATGAIEAIAEWGNEEQRRPDYKRADLLLALAHLQIQTFASFVGAMLGPDGHKDAIRLYVELVEKEMQPHAMAVHVANQGGIGG